MEANWIDYNKKEIYFLEWLVQATGFTEEQILENMKPENQKWPRSENIHHTLLEYLDNVVYTEDYITELFNWEKSMLIPSFFSWEIFRKKWVRTVLKHSNFKIKFSCSVIDNNSFKLIRSSSKSNLISNRIKIKEKKIKI
jgi:hypothetical protein